MPQELEDIFGGNQAADQTTQTNANPADAAPSSATQGGAPPATPVQPQAGGTATEAALPAGLLERARTAGLKLDGIDSSDKFAEFLLDQYMQARPYADYGRQSLAAQPSSDQKSGNQGTVPADSESEPEVFDLDGHFSSLWSAPQLDPQSQFAIQNGIVQLGDEGMYVPTPGFESMALPLLGKLNEAHIAQKTQMQKLFEGNFYKNVFDAHQPAIQHLVDQRIQEMLAERFQERDEISFVDKFKEDNKSWLYTPAGDLTAEGQKFADTVAELRQHGMTDPQKLASYAIKLAGINTQSQQPPVSSGETTAAAAPSAGTPSGAAASDGRQRDEHGRYLPAGTPAPAPKTKQETFVDDARKKAGANSSQQGYTDSGSDFVVTNEGELENMFTNAYKRHMAAA